MQSAFHRSFTARQCSPLIPDAYLEKEVTLSVSSLIHAISSRVKTDFASSMLKHSIGIRMGGSHGLSTACGRRIADPTVWTESKHRDAIESDHDPRHFLAGENRLQTVLYLRRSLEAAQLVAWALSQRLVSSLRHLLWIKEWVGARSTLEASSWLRPAERAVVGSAPALGQVEQNSNSYWSGPSRFRPRAKPAWPARIYKQELFNT